MIQTAEVLELVNAPALYSEFVAQLAEMKHNNTVVVFDYKTPKGNKDARSHVASIRTVKANLERARVIAGAEALVHTRLVNSLAGELKAGFEAMIEVHAVPLLAIENKEKARIEAHKNRIDSLNDYQLFNLDATAGEIMLALGKVSVFPIDDSLEEFKAEAAIAKDAAMIELTLRLQVRQKYESEQAELARLRVESDARAKADREAKIARDAADAATRDAELKVDRIATAARLALEEADRKALETARQKELELAQSKLREAEAETRAANAEKAAKAKAESDLLAKQTAEKADADKREANKKYRAKINNEALAGLVAAGIDSVVAKACIEAIAKGAVPHVRITY